MNPVHVSAPGKVMISGEYAVLGGTPALVAAADARAVVRAWPIETNASAAAEDRWPEGYTPTPEAVLTRQYAEARLGEVPMTMAVDVSALFAEVKQGASGAGRKLGLGSSAATAAGVAAAVAAAHGKSLQAPEVRSEVLRVALEGHRAVSPEGSGADVAAAALGGYVRFERAGTDVDARNVSWPAAIELALVWTGTPARTSDLIAHVNRLRDSQPVLFSRAMASLQEAALALLAAVEASSASSVFTAAKAHHDAMKALGTAAGAAIVTHELDAAARCAAAVGGAAKPSGAGGGDVAIAFLPAGTTDDFQALCTEGGLTLLPIRLGAPGPRLERRQAAPP